MLHVWVWIGSHSSCAGSRMKPLLNIWTLHSLWVTSVQFIEGDSVPSVETNIKCILSLHGLFSAVRGHLMVIWKLFIMKSLPVLNCCLCGSAHSSSDSFLLWRFKPGSCHILLMLSVFCPLVAKVNSCNATNTDGNTIWNWLTPNSTVNSVFNNIKQKHHKCFELQNSCTSLRWSARGWIDSWTTCQSPLMMQSSWAKTFIIVNSDFWLCDHPSLKRSFCKITEQTIKVHYIVNLMINIKFSHKWHVT